MTPAALPTTRTDSARTAWTVKVSLLSGSRTASRAAKTNLRDFVRRTGYNATGWDPEGYNKDGRRAALIYPPLEHDSLPASRL